MRGALGQMRPDTATIQRNTRTGDGGGGTVSNYASIATDVPCRVSPVGGGETGSSDTQSGDRVVQESTHVVTFAAGTDVTEADRIIVAGRTYDVTLVRTRGEWELSRRVEAREAVSP